MNPRLTLMVALALLLLVSAPAARASEPTASFTYAPSAPAPGEPVEFTSTSAPAPDHTGSLALAWDLDGDGAFDDAEGGRARHAFEAGAHVVRLRARHLPGHESVAEQTVQVGPAATPTPTPTGTATPAPTSTATPVPAANQPPVAGISSGCQANGVCSGLYAREHKPHTLDASPSHDPDGHIVRYEWDLDGTGGFEAEGGPTITHTFERRTGLVETGRRTVRVRVTDDAGATAEASRTLTLLEPSCESTVTRNSMRATGLCLRAHNGYWVSKLPITFNGITIVPKANRTIVVDPSSFEVRSNGATASVDVKGVRTTLVDGPFRWQIADGTHIVGFELAPDARLNGLKITGLSPSLELRPDGTSKLGLRVALPAQFGGATSDQPILVTPGRASASASEPLEFGVRNAAIGPIGLDHLIVRYHGEDLWEISAGVALPEPIAATIKGDAGIRAGAFEHAGAELSLPAPGIGPFGPVFLQRIAFRIEIDPKDNSKCVRKTGVEVIDQRKLLHDITGRWFNVPNLRVDHGYPTFALCGEVGLTAGPKVLDVAAIELDAGLGLATYADRPSVLRAFGDVSLVGIPLAEAALELHTNGYTRMHARFDWGVDGLASLKGFLQFEMMAPKFNAQARVDACLEFIDWCAGARALVSTKGVAVCLSIDVLFDDWNPGFGFRWGKLPTLYLAGCDIGPYKEHISGGLGDHITAVPASVRAKAAGFEQAIELPAGLPGATIVARGQGAPPKLTLVGPKGERITTPDDLRPVTRAPFFVLKDPHAHLTQFAIAKPSAGRWRVLVETGSAPVVSLASAQGLERPRIDARITGRGQRRTLAYRVKPVAGQRVTFVERGASAGRTIGAARAASGRLVFRPAPGASEQRRIVALVTQDGQERGEYEVARYRAPALARPARVPGLHAVRRGTRVDISWKGAGLHEATVRLTDGRRIVRRAHGTSLTVRGLGRYFTGSVSVRALLKAGMAGPSSRVRISR